MDTLRKSVLAGSWYPSNPLILKKDIEKYFNAVPDSDFKGEIIALIVPHAGYIYSGHVAAYAYKLVCSEKYDAVVVIGPSHRVAFQGVSVFSAGGYETPLGVVPVALELAERIKKISNLVDDIPAAHLQEHSVEIQLPFLQYALGSFSFVPLIMGDQDAATCEELARIIYKSVRGQKILLVASSDLSHFHNNNKAVNMDAVVLKYIRDFNTTGLLESLERRETEACGGGPIAVAMMVAGMIGANKVQILKYANSGDVTGDRSSVVGYTAAAYYK